MATAIARAGCTYAPDEPMRRQSILPESSIDAETVDINGTVRPHADWGERVASANQADVAATNYLRLLNAGNAAGTDVVIAFGQAAFIGAVDPAFDIPIAGNMQLAWVEVSAASSVPANASFNFQPGSGTVTVKFTQTNSRIYVAYKLTQLPAVLPVQSYLASFTITVITPPPPPPTNVRDPGAAYTDINCDGLYNGNDTLIANAVIRSGSYDTGDTRCLVIPTSVGTITANAIDFKSRGGGISSDVDLIASNGVLKLESFGGFIELPGKAARATTGLTLTTAGGDLRINGTTLNATAGKVTLTSANGALRGVGSQISGSGGVDIATGAGLVNLNSATLGSTLADIKILTTTGLTQGTSAILRAHTAIDIRTTSGSITLSSAQLSSSTNTILVDASSVALTANSAIATAPSMTLRSTTGTTLTGATLRTTTGTLAITASLGPIGLQNAVTTSATNVLLTLDGTLDIRGARLTAATTLAAEMARGSNEVLAAGAFIVDADNYLALNPNGKVTGTPAQGGLGK